MFDEIRCEEPLPDSWNPGDVWFQTKSFPDPCMHRYTITRNGRLVDSAGNDLDPEGYVTFYAHDREERWREYRAHFQRGRLVEIEIADDRRERRFFGLASFRWFDAPSYLFGDPDDEKDERAPVPISEPSHVTERSEREASLLAAVRSALPELRKLLDRANSHWEYEDPVYRLYHMSFKAFRLRHFTREIVTALQALLPGHPLNQMFVTIVRDGTEREFTPQSNEDWLTETRPIAEAFFHARFFLEMAVRYGEKLETPPKTLPSGYAALLYLYDLR
jgi:hypothetical protein